MKDTELKSTLKHFQILHKQLKIKEQEALDTFREAEYHREMVEETIRGLLKIKGSNIYDGTDEPIIPAQVYEAYQASEAGK